MILNEVTPDLYQLMEEEKRRKNKQILTEEEINQLKKRLEMMKNNINQKRLIVD